MDGDARSMAGEVTGREDLLGGRVRVELEGEAGDWRVSAAFGWPGGGEGEAALEPGECFLTLAGDGRELYASAVEGAVHIDADTAALSVSARFVVEEEEEVDEDEAECSIAAPVALVAVQCEIGRERWSGELRVER